jgi:hypothetical protein
VRDNLGDGEDGSEVTLGRVLLGGLPLLTDVSEGSNVPGRDEQVVIEALGRNSSAELGGQVKQPILYLRWLLISNGWRGC